MEKSKKEYGIAEVKAVANLARLEFSDEEMEGLREEMNRIIAFADKLGNIDTTGVEATAHIVLMKNVFRDDVVEKEFSSDELLAAAAEKEDGYIVVPNVVEE